MANLISNEWKHTLETTPTDPILSLVSLYDLFYDENGKLWIESTDPNAGTKLAHDVICLNRGFLKQGNKIDTSSPDIEQSTWWTYGIDVSLPLFDARSKYKEVLCNASVGTGGKETQIFQGNRFRIYDKDAALAPRNLQVFTVRSVLTEPNITSAAWDAIEPPTVGVFSASGNPSDETSDILLACPDSAFKSTLVTQDGMEAYNRIFINPYSWYAICLVIRATGMDYKQILGAASFKTQKNLTSFGNTVGDFKNFWSRADVADNYVARAVDLGANSYTPFGDVQYTTYDSNRWFYLLKNTFVWVRAPFYGDYIIPDNFGQDLNAEAKVVHNELMLSGAGDFKKYDVYASNTSQVPAGTKISTEQLNTNTNLGIGCTRVDESFAKLSPSEESMPYIPKTSPTVDIYTSLLLDGNGALKGVKSREDTSNFSTKLISDPSSQIDEFLEANCSGNDPLVRGLPIAAINRDNAIDETSNSKPENLAPPNYFDPESRLEGKDYSKVGRFPTIIPKDGNLYVDGRIIGPTIDEIWIMLKKLTGGRLSDFENNSDTTANVARALNLDLGIPYGSSVKNQNDTDTTMTEVPDSQFNFTYEGTQAKVGDPIDFVYTPDNTSLNTNLFGQTLKVTKFINQNDAIVYPVYKSLKDLSIDITTFDSTEDKERGITNFTAWDGIGKSTKEVKKEVANPNDPTDIQTVTETVSKDVGDNTTILEGVWGPREVPYSLRELEAMVMGNKFNIITQARFVKENFAVTGGLGKVAGYDKEDMYNYTSGSMYQMHKNYNFNVSDPNTYYDATGTATGYDENGKIVGTRATIDDADIRTEAQIREGHIRFAETYGSSPALSENAEKYSSSDVYLSAYGDWRYVSDHNRIPCLRAEY